MRTICGVPGQLKVNVAHSSSHTTVRQQPKRARLTVIAIIVAVGCVCLVAHTTFDLNGLRLQVTPKAGRLEPPEDARLDSAHQVTVNHMGLGSEDAFAEAFEVRSNTRDVEFNLRI